MTKTETKPAVSPDDLLKAVVTGQAESAADAEAPEAAAPTLAVLRSLKGIDRRTLAIPGACLALGALLGGGVIAMTRSSALSSDAVAALSTTLDAGRTETARLGSDIAQLHQVLADLRASTDTARREASTRSGALGERLAQLDKNLSAKTAALGERLEQVEREQNARISGLASQIDRRAATVVKPEPTQTGSLAETRAVEPKAAEPKVTDAKITEAKLSDARPADVKKASLSDKPPVIDAWAVREVYDGMAILENRRHRLLEIGPGETLPGFGRVEGIERRGRDWVVVTRQGLVTPQPW
ncbi:hypothetical protein SAMN05216360_106126 [Methylobacterium phyllostachyos]|uniref:Uncharacterized protein n=1 Tax=Methylobacterium phyllostachyos TaxID=582672 RepID=A0A1G9Z885_9HYPH|nr:hypothetical protein [Methylobacterium phyllostachyos]SDN16603.1 hypothetical protein SAMN05216360_106126 [Methylobacterium phyllostachyos]